MSPEPTTPAAWIVEHVKYATRFDHIPDFNRPKGLTVSACAGCHTLFRGVPERAACRRCSAYAAKAAPGAMVSAAGLSQASQSR